MQTTTITVEQVHFDTPGEATIIGRDTDGRRTEAHIDQARGNALAGQLETDEEPVIEVQPSELA